MYKNIIIIIIFLISILYSFPNFINEDPIIQISTKNDYSKININEINNIIKDKNLKIKNLESKDHNNIIIRFNSTESQLSAFEILKLKIENNYNISLNIIPSKEIPILEKIGANPMKLGLDLRGGVYILLDINTKNFIKTELKNNLDIIQNELRKKDIKYYKASIIEDKKIEIKFKSKENMKEGLKYINKEQYKNLKIENKNIELNSIILNIDKNKKKDIKNTIIEKTIKIISNRINELGISDSTVQRKGEKQIIVEIPGIQDINRAKKILGKTATINFMMVDTENDINQVMNGKILTTSKIYYDKNKNPYLINKKKILNGSSIINASSGIEEQFNKPCINIKLGRANTSLFEKTTMENIGKPMAIIYKEKFIEKKNKNGIIKNKERKIENIINIAVIMSPLSSSFQITGLNMQESKDLAIILRSGSLPTTLSIIEEKIIGPTLGYRNIQNGLISIIISILSIIIFMYILYNKLGIITNITLIMNILLIISIMSIINATITLPGIAGIVLTIGMAVDANILIFERIKEEKKKNIMKEMIIENGFKNAFTSIFDSNITSLLIGIILFSIGNGPIKGFAITLSIGILTSMYFSLVVTKRLIISLNKKVDII